MSIRAVLKRYLPDRMTLNGLFLALRLMPILPSSCPLTVFLCRQMRISAFGYHHYYTIIPKPWSSLMRL